MSYPLLKRLCDVVVAPSDLFHRIDRSHSPLIAVLITSVILLACLVPFLESSIGREAFRQQQIQPYERVRDRNPALYERALSRIDSGLKSAVYRTELLFVVGIWMSTAFFAALVYSGMRILGAEDESYPQVFLVFSYASTIYALELAFLTLLNYLSGSFRGAAMMILIVPALDSWLPQNFFGRFVLFLNPFTVWYTLIAALGLAAVYKKTFRFFGVWLVGAYVFSVVLRAALGGHPEAIGVIEGHLR